MTVNNPRSSDPKFDVSFLPWRCQGRTRVLGVPVPVTVPIAVWGTKCDEVQYAFVDRLDRGSLYELDSVYAAYDAQWMLCTVVHYITQDSLRPYGVVRGSLVQSISYRAITTFLTVGH
jgi:hypothetical protein